MKYKIWNRNEGFTLAELLITVAIIGVLVAIGIPVLSNQLEKSREAPDRKPVLLLALCSLIRC